ncbi:hypothetical protein A5753_06550 [Mycobacterium sp. 852002-51971_SCH5477799-a]|uniref:hypothetical protein n=1 Tax=Mycobacterium sp. 852002-51971_SCH5477799-a TaxID=1834106 RepID=UPI0008017FDA|nr:hypothetical protein [Mycobacterium sp. 852002-51971_SCH5477799-a]OBF66372.1 hypothetical protein A5753_06550 [Mycobacterium sp. 852002-51971_SCH5477799-a]
MNAPNPFDFSDFGPGKQAQSGGGQQPAQGGGFAGGFNPWANQRPAAARPATSDAFQAPSAFDPTSGRDAFGQLTASPAGIGALTTAGPPLVWFVVALALGVAGIALAGASALGRPMIAAAVAGWLLAGPLAIGALAVFSRVDTRRRAEAIYSAPTWTSRLYWIVLAVCLLGIAVGAWQIALWAGTL